MVNYVDELDVDIIFLKTCGWDVPSEITVPFNIFTFFFLKKAIQLYLIANDMVVLAQNFHKCPAFNLCDMVLKNNGDNTQRDEVFLQNAQEKIKARLTKYTEKFLKKRFNLKPKK